MKSPQPPREAVTAASVQHASITNDMVSISSDEDSDTEDANEDNHDAHLDDSLPSVTSIMASLASAEHTHTKSAGKQRQSDCTGSRGLIMCSGAEEYREHWVSTSPTSCDETVSLPLEVLRLHYLARSHHYP